MGMPIIRNNLDMPILNFLLWTCQDALSNKLHNEIDMWKMKQMIKDKKKKEWNKW
jgi:hypothetical protein